MGVKCPKCGAVRQVELAQCVCVNSMTYIGGFLCQMCQEQVRFVCYIENPFREPRIMATVLQPGKS